jgi:hypothetical protein
MKLHVNKIIEKKNTPVEGKPYSIFEYRIDAINKDSGKQAECTVKAFTKNEPEIKAGQEINVELQTNKYDGSHFYKYLKEKKEWNPKGYKKPEKEELTQDAFLNRVTDVWKHVSNLTDDAETKRTMFDKVFGCMTMYKIVPSSSDEKDVDELEEEALKSSDIPF